MEPMHYIGLTVQKQKISYCVKDSSGGNSGTPRVSAVGTLAGILPQRFAQGEERTPGRLFAVAVISPRLSCASKDGCNIESDVRPSKDR